MALFLKECTGCGGVEERVLIDSWTGVELCLTCVCEIAPRLTNSPAAEGDNLNELLEEML